MNKQGMVEGWKRLLAALPVRQRILIAVTAVLVVGGLFAMSAWRKERDFKPLYTGMAPEDAGAIVEKLKESDVEHRLTDGGASVLVPSGRVAELRLLMAGAGLPKTGRIGFELFDKTNLGTTDFAEQVNFRRALEGELERSIKSVSEIEQARVHVTFPKDSVFLENRLPAKASVLLKLRPGVHLTNQNVIAISHMVASAVEGLTPNAVSIMDVHGNLLSRPVRSDSSETSEAAIEYRQKIERDLLAKINTTLEPLLGADKFRAGVSVDCDFTSGEQSEETYDPEKTVMLTSQKSEETGGSANSGGVPGTASNLPRPPARSASSLGMSRRTENISYQSSKTVKRVKLPEGTIRRISASVLLDQAVRWEGKAPSLKRVLVPPSPESIRAIREVISAAIGFVPTRGDQLAIETLPFETTLQSPAPETPSAPQNTPKPASPLPAWAMNPFVLAGVGGGLLVLVGLAWFLRRRAKRKRKKVEMATALPHAENASVQLPNGTAQAETLAPGNEQHQITRAEQDVAQVGEPLRIQTLASAVRITVSEDAALAARVLRTWLEEAAK